MDRPFRLALSIVSMFWLAACGSSSSASALTAPTATSSATATLVTDTFTGSVDQNGTVIYPFTGYRVVGCNDINLQPQRQPE
jgi:hypothetical protein